LVRSPFPPIGRWLLLPGLFLMDETHTPTCAPPRPGPGPPGLSPATHSSAAVLHAPYRR
jgi:hypothetical protein